ncbi:MAG: response regulator [Actinomycetota bacterium]
MEDSIIFPIRVVLADDHPMIRRGVRAMLETSRAVEVCGEASNGLELIEQVWLHRPDVVVVDLKMAQMDGLEAIRRIRSSYPQIRALVLTGHESEELARESMKAGASAFLLKTVYADELIKAIVSVAGGRPMLHTVESAAGRKTSSTSSSMSNEPAYAPATGGREEAHLSRRELQVLELMAGGKSNKQIARDLGIGAQTVKSHVSHILTKLKAPDRAGAVAFGFRKGLVR